MVRLSTAGGRQKTIETSEVGSETIQTVTHPTGSKTVMHRDSDGSRTLSYPDGTTITDKQGVHPIWGKQLPVTEKRTTKLPSGKARELQVRYFAEFADSNNPLSTTRFGHTLKVSLACHITGMTY